MVLDLSIGSNAALMPGDACLLSALLAANMLRSDLASRDILPLLPLDFPGELAGETVLIPKVKPLALPGEPTGNLGDLGVRAGERGPESDKEGPLLVVMALSSSTGTLREGDDTAGDAGTPTCVGTTASWVRVGGWGLGSTAVPTSDDDDTSRRTGSRGRLKTASSSVLDICHANQRTRLDAREGGSVRLPKRTKVSTTSGTQTQIMQRTRSKTHHAASALRRGRIEFSRPNKINALLIVGRSSSSFGAARSH
jgi:hypothetical protein